MTFKSLMNFGGYKDSYYSNIERYHSGPGGYHHSGSGGYHHGSRGSSKGKGGDKGAALSALTLLAFLFLLNVMQQSMQDNMPTTPTPTTGFVIREVDQPAVVDAKEEKENAKKDEAKRVSYGTPAKSKIQRLNSQYIK